MSKKRVVRIKPRSFDCDWESDLKALGVRIPKNVPELRYTPVNHDPIPFALEIDLVTKKLVKRIVGVMPNALYKGHIYSWDEFCALPAVRPTGDENKASEAGEELPDGVCCMFRYRNPDHAVLHNELSLVDDLEEFSRSEKKIFRCRRCGAYVYYEYEEAANLSDDWDNADIFEWYIPVRYAPADPKSGSSEAEWSFISPAKCIRGHNMELDTGRKYYYEKH